MSKKRHTAAALLGAALSDLIPQGFLLKSGGKGSTFYYDIVLGESLSPVMLPHLENRVKELISKNHLIKVHEMIPSNAYEFFQSRRRYYPAQFVRKAEAPLVKVVQIDAFIDLVDGEFLERTQALSSFHLTGVEERPPLLYRKDKKQVFRVMGQLDDAQAIDPFELGQELGLFDVKISRRDDFLEEIQLQWRKEGEALLFRLYQKWREVHLKEGFEIVIGGPLKEGRFAEFFFEKGHHYDRVTTHCMEEEKEAAIQKSLRIIEALSLVPQKNPFLTVRKNRESITIEHSAFPSVEQMITQVLEDPEKDLSQKKELLGMITVCNELG